MLKVWGTLKSSRVYLSKHQLELGSMKLGVVKSTPPTGARSDDSEAKQRNYLIGYSLSGCLIWESLVGCLWLVVLKFHFLRFQCTDWLGLGFGYTGHQGIRATSVWWPPWPPCLISLTQTNRRLADFSIKGPTGSAAPTWLCCRDRKPAIDYINEGVWWWCPKDLYFWTVKLEFHIISMCHKIFFFLLFFPFKDVIPILSL